MLKQNSVAPQPKPYRTMNKVIEGAVLTFVDVTAAGKYQEALGMNEELRAAQARSKPG